ncbi:MAG: cation:proton antiporter [Oligoflexia bacterium]|nr:cation:proton antiporter [Oligoflexia bacterium]
MHDTLLFDLGKSIIGASALGYVAHLFRLPLILAYIGCGAILGPHLGFGFIKEAESIATLSEIGLVLLMFILGLEIDLRKLLQAGKAVLINGFTQFVGCLVLGFGFFYFVGINKTYGQYDLLYLSVACALSSTLICIKILSDRMDLDSLSSRITLGILVIQDLWAIGFLAVQPNLENMSAMSLVISAGKAGLLVAARWAMAKFVLPFIFGKIGKQPELMLISAMAWCTAVCGLADFLSLSHEMGALIAGVTIASFPYHVDVASKISSLRDFFITLFFVSLGLRIPFPSKEVLSLAGIISVFVLFSRIPTIFPILHSMKYGNRASLLPAVNLSQLSEFALVLAAIGVDLKHIHFDLLSALTLAMVFTALISSFAIPKGHEICQRVAPWLERLGFKDLVGGGRKTEPTNGSSGYNVVLLGFHRVSSSLLHEMLNRYSKSAVEKILVVDFNPEAHHRLKDLGVNCKYGDIGNIDTLRNMHLESSKLLICTIPDSFLKGTSNLKLVKALKNLAPHARIIATAEGFSSAVELYDAGASYVFVPRLVSAHFLADVVERIQTEGARTLRESSLTYLKDRKEVIP